MAKVVVSPSGCWEWTGASNPRGYGHINIGDSTYRSTHKVMWELKNGPTPEGCELDHIVCSNPPCCNPDHLNPVPHRINAIRSLAPNMVAHEKGECVNGHDQEEYAYRRKATGQVVYCRACRNERERVHQPSS